MRLDVKNAARLWDMLDAARAIIQFTTGQQFEQFLADRKTRNAVERNLEIIGEAARHVSEEVQNSLPGIPWTAVIGLRNVISHEYGEILYEKVWSVCTDRLPALIRELEAAGVEDAPRIEGL